MRNKLLISFLLVAGLILALIFTLELNSGLLGNSSKLSQSSENLPTVDFWQYWTGSEREPIEELVNKFNSEFAEDYGFKVKMLTISMPRKKILMSIVGKVPPDLVHLDGDMVTDFALRSALSDLGGLVERSKGDLDAQETNLRRLSDLQAEKFIPVYWDMLNLRGRQWAVPLMPSAEAMHINLNLFKKLGLEKIPATLEELEEVFDLASDLEDFKNLAWLPTWPPWVGRFLPVVLGSSWAECDEEGCEPTANSKENMAAWTWVQKISQKIPAHKLRAFAEYHSYQSPDNPFYSQRLVFENNGVWERNLAKHFAPEMEIAIAPFPISKRLVERCKKDGVPRSSCIATLVSVDALAIPDGAEHPKRALRFINWLTSQENLEYLALKQQKFTPLKEQSSEFIAKHPNPYIQTFIDLAKSPYAQAFPQVPYVQRYKREIKETYNRVVRNEISADRALAELQDKMLSVDF